MNRISTKSRQIQKSKSGNSTAAIHKNQNHKVEKKASFFNRLFSLRQMFGCRRNQAKQRTNNQKVNSSQDDEISLKNSGTESEHSLRVEDVSEQSQDAEKADQESQFGNKTQQNFGDDLRRLHPNEYRTMVATKIEKISQQGQIKLYMQKMIENAPRKSSAGLEIHMEEIKKYASASEFQSFQKRFKSSMQKNQRATKARNQSSSNQQEVPAFSALSFSQIMQRQGQQAQPRQNPFNFSFRPSQSNPGSLVSRIYDSPQKAQPTADAKQPTKQSPKLQPSQQQQKQESPRTQAKYKNCSQAVIDRDKHLSMIHKLMKEEKLVQKHQELRREAKTAKEAQSVQGDSETPSGHMQASEQVEAEHEIDPNQDFKSLICPLCFNFIYKCQTTVCGHSFCTKCIDEYLIIKKSCFVCEKTIRTTKGSVLLPCFTIDDVISQLISNSEDADVKIQWETQKCEFTTWQLKKKIDKIEVGEKVDVRDTDYIWCTGGVKMVIESIGKEPILAIHYDGWNRWYDEFLPISSPRLARLGFYTTRDDIPKYRMRQPLAQGETPTHKNSMQAFIVNRITSSTTGSNAKGSKSEGKDPRKKKLSANELANLTEDERRRHENSNYGDAIEDRLEEFFNKHQDVNHQSGNSQISGVARTRNRSSWQPDHDAPGEGQEVEAAARVAGSDDDQDDPMVDEALEALIERQNIQQLQQGVTPPIFLRNSMSILNSVGSGGAAIANALLGQQGSGAPPSERRPAGEDRDRRAGAGANQQAAAAHHHHHQSLAATLMRQIAGIRDQASARLQQHQNNQG